MNEAPPPARAPTAPRITRYSPQVPTALKVEGPSTPGKPPGAAQSPRNVHTPVTLPPQRRLWCCPSRQHSISCPLAHGWLMVQASPMRLGLPLGRQTRRSAPKGAPRVQTAPSVQGGTQLSACWTHFFSVTEPTLCPSRPEGRVAVEGDIAGDRPVAPRRLGRGQADQVEQALLLRVDEQLVVEVQGQPDGRRLHLKNVFSCVEAGGRPGLEREVALPAFRASALGPGAHQLLPALFLRQLFSLTAGEDAHIPASLGEVVLVAGRDVQGLAPGQGDA